MLEEKHTTAPRHQIAYRAPTADEIVDRLGGTSKCAKIFGIRTASVSGWRTNGIPAARLHFLTVVHPDAVIPVKVSGAPDGERRLLAKSDKAHLSTADLASIT